MAIRARDFASEDAALEDLRRLLRATSALRPVSVADPVGRTAWWLVLDGEVVLVAPRPVAPTVAATRAQSVIRLLQRIAEKA